MTDVLDVAKYICEKLVVLDAYKLQKLTYYSRVWGLVLFNDPLFDDKIEAWVTGPVCRVLYEHFKDGSEVTNERFNFGDPSLLSTQQKNAIDFVIQNYGERTGRELSYLSHTEDPWINARKRAGAGHGEACLEAITNEDIYNYYSVALRQ